MHTSVASNWRGGGRDDGAALGLARDHLNPISASSLSTSPITHGMGEWYCGGSCPSGNYVLDNT